VYTPFGDVDQFRADAVKCYERTLLEAAGAGINMRALILANPHNPLGKSKTGSSDEQR
jgi:bifunctional pyridoxal-dependent enzyme with beta-cystathionase and maltose regulon repressor activities